MLIPKCHLFPDSEAMHLKEKIWLSSPSSSSSSSSSPATIGKMPFKASLSNVTNVMKNMLSWIPQLSKIRFFHFQIRSVLEVKVGHWLIEAIVAKHLQVPRAGLCIITAVEQTAFGAKDPQHLRQVWGCLGKSWNVTPLTPVFWGFSFLCF